MSHSTEDQLAPGESILWTGAPNRERLLMRIDYLLVPVGFVIGVVSIAAFIAALLAIISGDDAAAAVIGLFVAFIAGVFALYLVFGRFISRFRRARDSVYVMTESRVIERRAQREGEPVIKFVRLTDDPPVSLRSHYEQRGTIRVGKGSTAIDLFNLDRAAVVMEEIHAQIAQVKRS